MTAKPQSLCRVFGLKIENGRIVEIDLIADPEHLGRLDLEMLGE